MRHIEEREAMQEEIRRLTAEVAQLKPKPKPKADPKPREPLDWAPILSVLVPVVICVFVVGLLGYAAVVDARNHDERNGPAMCYLVARPADASGPGEPWYIWAIKKGRNRNWEERGSRQFATAEEGRAAVARDGGKLCP